MLSESMKLNITMLLAALLSFATGYAGIGIIPRPLAVTEGKGSVSDHLGERLSLLPNRCGPRGIFPPEDLARRSA